MKTPVKPASKKGLVSQSLDLWAPLTRWLDMLQPLAALVKPFHLPLTTPSNIS